MKPPTPRPGRSLDLTALFAISVAVNVVDTVTDAHVDSAGVDATR